MGTGGGGAKSGRLQWPMALARLVAKVQLKQSEVQPTLPLFLFWHVPP